MPTEAGELALRRAPGVGSPLVCLHGFTLHGGMFTELAAMTGRPIIAPDLPGHGRTTVAPVTLETTLTALAEGLSSVEQGPVILVGYSQGGRIALQLAAHHPDVCAALVVISATPGLDETERKARRVVDEARAARLEAEGLAAFLDAWSAHPLVGTTGLDPIVAAVDRERRNENSAAGLAAALRGLGQGSLPAVDLDHISAPVLWVAGARDDAYAAAARAQATAGHGEMAIIADAGHNVVLEAPRALLDRIDGFLSSLP